MSETPIIINALGELHNPNAPLSEAASDYANWTSEQYTIDARALADTRASGLTALNITLGYVTGDLPPYEQTLRELDRWDAILADHPDDLLHVTSVEDIRAAAREGRTGVIYGFQNAEAVGDDPGRISTFAERGVRVVQLTYNQANALGGGASAPAATGLTDLGREVIDALNDHHLMVDLSHSGELTCLQAAVHSRAPVSINHTGCRALTDLPRNKTDEELRLVASRGGFVGIYFMPFLNPSGQASAADVVEHIVHAVNVCGEDHVGIGTDGPVTAVDDLDAFGARMASFIAQRQTAGVSAAGESADILPFVVDLRGVDQFRRLIRLLEQHGFSTGRIEKIMGGNFLAFAERVWKA